MADVTISAAPFSLSIEIAGEIENVVGWKNLSEFQKAEATLHYICTVTGDANGLSNITVPITSFQSRRRSGSPSYLQAVIPGTDHYLDIADRLGGDLVISVNYLIGGILVFESELTRVNIGNIDLYIGGKSQSLTLSGEKQTTYTDSKEVALSDIVLYSFVSGKQRVRLSAINISVNPGDTVTANGSSAIADLITTTVSISAAGKVTSSMEVSES